VGSTQIEKSVQRGKTNMTRLGDVVAVLSDRVEIEFIGDPTIEISNLSTLDAAGPADLTFLSQPKYLGKLASSRAACVVLPRSAREAGVARGACLLVDDPYYCFALITQWWKARLRNEAPCLVHPSAFIDPAATVASDASIGAFVCVEAGAIIQSGVSVGAHCVIGREAYVGANTQLAPRVTLGERCRIGARCIVHSGVVIGADGFGFAPHEGQWIKIEQLGSVQIGDDVEIGANTCIDRGALLDTVIEDGVKLDNLVQIGHNVRVGKHSALAGCAGVAGSAVIGAHCTVGGGAIVLGHLTLADHVHISAASIVTRSISKPGHYSGLFPIDDNAAWEKNAASLKQLHALRERLRQLEKWMADRAEKS
jgi:UDP-3-O-[3-hydroxymyristoyl] glucosamine N-acyltransferase